MKILLTGFIFLLCLSASSAQVENADSVIFKGNTDPSFDGNTVVLYNKTTGDHDSAQVSHGQFVFNVKFKEPTRYMFYSKYELKNKGGYAPFGVIITKPGIYRLNADMRDFFKTKMLNDSSENNLYQSFVAGGLADKQQITQKAAEKFGNNFEEHLTKHDSLYAEVREYLENMDASYNRAQAERLGAFIKKYPDSFACVFLLSSMAPIMSGEKIQEYYGMLGENYKNTSYASNIQKLIASKNITKIGSIAPDFMQPDTAGRQIKLADFRGNYLLLDFWASWCSPCRQENPNLIAAYNRYHGKGFNILSVSLDQPGKKAAWLNAIHHDGLLWTQVSDLAFWNNAVAKLYGIRAIPQNFLIDKDGKIIAVNLRGESLNKKLSEIFRE